MAGICGSGQDRCEWAWSYIGGRSQSGVVSVGLEWSGRPLVLQGGSGVMGDGLEWLAYAGSGQDRSEWAWSCIGGP